MLPAIVTVLFFVDLSPCTGHQVSNITKADSSLTLRETAADNVKAVTASRDDHGQIADPTDTVKAVTTRRDDHGEIADPTDTVKAVTASRDDHGQIADPTDTAKTVTASGDDHGEIADPTDTVKAVTASRDDHGQIADPTDTVKAVTASGDDHGEIADPTDTVKAVTTRRDDQGEIADPTDTVKTVTTRRDDHGEITDPTDTVKAVTTRRDDQGEIADPTDTVKTVTTRRDDHGEITDPTDTVKTVTTRRDDHGEITDPTDTVKTVTASRDDHGQIADPTDTVKAVTASGDDHGEIADPTDTVKAVTTRRDDHGQIADPTDTVKAVTTRRDDHGQIADPTDTVKAVTTRRDDHGQIADPTDTVKTVPTRRDDHGQIADFTDTAKAETARREDHGGLVGYQVAEVSRTKKQTSKADFSAKNTESDDDPRNTTGKIARVIRSVTARSDEKLTSAITDTEDACKNNITVNLGDPEGVIDWSETNGSMRCTWFINMLTSQAVGLVLQFDDVCLQRGTTADDDDSVAVKTTTGELLRHVTGCLSVLPVLVHSPNATVTVTQTRHNTLNGTARDSAESDVSRFTLRYKAYPAVLLPPQLPSGQYNCSPPYVVPEALLCDMAEQCLGGEDERNSSCSYHSAECGDWLPYGDLCLHFVFPSTAISPLSAESRCKQTDERSALASLHDPEGKRLAALVTSLSGYNDLIVGLAKKDPYDTNLSHLYRFLWSWDFLNSLEPEGPDLDLQDPSLNCVTLRTKPVVHFHPVHCSAELTAGFACIKVRQGLDSPESLLQVSEAVTLTYPTVSRHLHHPFVKKCSDGSFVQSFFSCPWAFSAGVASPSAVHQKQIMTRGFECRKLTSVHYTLTCDGRDDCGDGTDEHWCYLGTSQFPADPFFLCKDRHRIMAVQSRCDGKEDCWGGSDERLCQACSDSSMYLTELGCLPMSYAHRGLDENESLRKIPTELALSIKNRTSEIRVLTMDGYGTASLHYSQDSDCPETHYLCPRGLCIPTFLLSNKERDCPFPFRDDESVRFSDVPCPGYYRCRLEKTLCLHPDYVCDGVHHCPLKDDEMYCDHVCPDVCICEGFAYTCTDSFDTEQHPYVRYLDLSHSLRPAIGGLVSLNLLRFLNLSFCQLKEFSHLDLTLVVVLDLSFNHLTSAIFDAFETAHLNLSGNPLVRQFTTDYTDVTFSSTRQTLRSLLLTQTGLRQISGRALQNFTSLRFLDLSGNGPVRFGKESMLGLRELLTLLADDQRLCCAHAALYPDTDLTCEAPADELSSCSDLLRSSYLRVTLWLQAAMAVTGNVGVFVFRVFRESQLTSSVFRVLVTNLCVADFLMGVYMVIIGAADARFSGQYLWKQDDWTESDQCKAAGFLALLSSEVSAFIICLITLDRFLVLRFPFKRGLHMTSRSAMAACGAVWGVGVVLATVPLLPFTQHWQFYGQTGICLPLPITRRQFSGQAYSLAVFIGLNFVLFLLIGAGQLSIFLAVHSIPAAGRKERRQQDMAIARRLFLIVLTDLCCWLPVGVMGLLAARGVPIPGELNVWTAVFVLPLNSALNPFLYTLNTLLERGKKRREEKRMARMISRLRAELVTWPEDKLEELDRLVQSSLKRSSGGPQSRVDLTEAELVEASNDASPCSETTCDTNLE